MRRSTLAGCAPNHGTLRTRPTLWAVLAIAQTFCIALSPPALAQNEAAAEANAAEAPAETPATEAPAADKPAEAPAAEPAPETPPAEQPVEEKPEPATNGVSALLKIDKPLIEEEKVKEFKKKDFDFANTLQRGDLSAASRELVSEGIRTRVYSLTLRSNLTDREVGAKIVEQFRREILQAGMLKDPAGARAFREFVMQELVARCSELLDNHLFARFQAVVLLANANLVEPNPQNPGAPGQAFTPAFEPLLKVLNDPNQPDALKIQATVGLTNINLRGSTPPSPNQRVQAGQAFIRELARQNTHEWYQVRLLEGLSSIDQVLDLAGKPFISDAIDATVKDANRKWPVRCAAAKALGRTQLTPDMKVNLFVIDILNLARDAADAMNAEESKSAFWTGCFWDIYFAFRSFDGTAGLTEKVKRAGMQKFEKIVKEGFEQYMPLMNHVIATEQVSNFPDEMLNPFREWLQTNTPADYQPKVDTGNGTKQVQRTNPPSGPAEP